MRLHGRMPEWPNGADCKSVCRRFESGSGLSGGYGDAMLFSQWVYRGAAVYGTVVTLPLFFTEQRFGREHPPAVTHPEFYYGFLGLVIAWQLAFWVIGGDPVRYRPLMPATFIEKFAFVISTPLLVALGRTPLFMLLPVVGDGLLGVLFVAAWRQTPRGPAGAHGPDRPAGAVGAALPVEDPL